MANGILNASGLDGATGFAGTNVAADNAVLGAEARIVITADANLASANVNLAGAAGVYAFGMFAGDGLAVRFRNGVGVIGDYPLPTLRQPASPTRGIARTFGFASGYIAAPVGATQWALVESGGGEAAMFRPYGMGTSAAARRPRTWSPGDHANPDLDLAAWPDLLPNAEADGFALEPIPLRKSFVGDSGIPTTRRVASTSARFATVTLALNAVDRDILEQFWRANHDEFWFVRPDTGDLCIAEWADDGDPKDEGGQPGARRTSVRLLLREP